MTSKELSDRERDLITLAAQGLTDQAIATRLGISLFTVHNYWTRIRAKMGGVSRPEMVAKMLTYEYRDTMDKATGQFRRSVAALLEIEDLVTKQERDALDEIIENAYPDVDRAAIAEARQRADAIREEARDGNEYREMIYSGPKYGSSEEDLASKDGDSKEELTSSL